MSLVSLVSLQSLALKHAPVAPNHLRVEPRALLERPLLRFQVHVDDSEALRKAEAPLEVVEERPDVVALEVDSFFDRVVDGLQVLAEVFDAERVRVRIGQRDRGVIEGGSVFGDVEREVAVALDRKSTRLNS